MPAFNEGYDSKLLNLGGIGPDVFSDEFVTWWPVAERRLDAQSFFDLNSATIDKIPDAVELEATIADLAQFAGVQVVDGVTI